MTGTPFRNTRQLGQLIGEWALVFGLLLLAIWLVTQQENAAQLILLLLLLIITINFSLPPAFGAVGLTPLVAVSSLLVVGLETAVPLAALSFLIAELARPLWNPMWDYVNLQQPTWSERLATIAIHLLTLTASGLIYRLVGGVDPLRSSKLEDLIPFAALTLSYGAIQLTLQAVLWLALQRPLRAFLVDNAPAILTTTLLAQPFAVFGAITFVSNGMPVFVIFSMGVMVFSLVTWLSWQRRYVAQQQLHQFGLLNQISLSLRETLDLPTVLARTHQHVTDLIPADQFTIALRHEDGNWQRPLPDQADMSDMVPFLPDGLIRWVATNGRLLDLHSHNLHYATRRNLALPTPAPTAWLGVPLSSGDQALGVMALARFRGKQPFSHWSQQLLVAIAGQVSAAILNARLYSETVRLYNLTDEALARRLEQLQALLNSVQEGVLMLDTNGRILLINPPAMTLLQNGADGAPRPQLDDNTAVTRLGYSHAEWQERQVYLQAAVPPPGQTTTFTLTVETAAGPTRRAIERSETAVYAQEGQVMGWLLTLRDITAQQELAEQRANLTRMIVHDLRNPITTLISTIGAIEQQLSPATPADVPEMLHEARQVCADMLDMVDSLLDINRMEAGQLEPDAEAMRLPPLLATVIRRITSLARQRQIGVSAHIAPDLPPIWGDSELLRRVLLNLLDNALKFTPAGGQIEIVLQGETAVSGHEPGVRCQISDTGPGVPAAFREQVFDRFMRTNPGGAQVRGAGLGLAFCRMAVLAHHGRIWVEDAPGGGSRFVFTLPGIPLFE